jgi:hypothetical protein
VPPEVTVADLLVVVGVVDVAVVVVVVVLVDFAAGEVDVGVAFVDAEDDELVGEGAVTALLVPGCSFATRTPMRAVDAVAATTAPCVTRRSRARTRWRDWGELNSRFSFIPSPLRSTN